MNSSYINGNKRKIMDGKKLLFGTIAGAVTSFIAGFLIFGLALSSFFAANTAEGIMQDPPNMLWIVIGSVLFSLLITMIFVKWAGIKTLASGAKAGFWIGLLVELGYHSFLYAGMNIYNDLGTLLISAVTAAVVWAIGGAAVGWALGMVKDPA